MKLFTLAFLLFFCDCNSFAQVNTPKNIEEILLQSLQTENPIALSRHLKNKIEVQRAIQLCEKALTENPADNNLLKKTAYLHYRMGWLYADKTDRKKYYSKFYNYAKHAIETNPNDFYSCLLLAAAKAKIVGYLSNGEQVRVACELAKDMQDLVERDKTNPDALYLLSWLNFEISQIPPFKKFLASTLFGGLPEGLSSEMAIALLKNAIELRPNYLVYQYDLGFYYLRTGDKGSARQQFETVLSMKPKSAECEIYQHRSLAKLKEL